MALSDALQEPRPALHGHAAGCHDNSYLAFMFLELPQPFKVRRGRKYTQLLLANEGERSA
jgi:hypothetical protein